MPPRPPRDPATVGSFAELRGHYKTLVAQLDECKRMKGATNEALRHRAGEVRGAREEVKKAQRKVITLTKKEHAKSKEKSSAAYSATACTVLLISYQVIEISGGFGKWSPVFEHEATIGALQVMIGTVLAYAMRPLQ
jgi:hypothetical protein